MERDKQRIAFINKYRKLLANKHRSHGSLNMVGLDFTATDAMCHIGFHNETAQETHYLF